MIQKKNIVVVVARGMRSDVVGGGQYWPIETPNIQRLADNGARMVGTSGCPVDPGGLLTLFTGMHGRQHGVMGPGARSGQLGQVVGCEGGWVGALSAGGYDVRGVGCVSLVEPWLSESTVIQDVDCVSPSACPYLDAMARKGLVAEVLRQRVQRQKRGVFDPYRLQLEPADDIDSYICARAAETLERMPLDQPWVLLVVLSGPGNDLPAPMIYNELVNHEGLAAGFAPVDISAVDVLVEPNYPRVELQRLDQKSVGRIRSDYLGRVGLCDHGIGWLLAKLNKRADQHNTWFTFASDRGQLIGEHGVVGHRSFLSGAVEVPLILTPPKPMHQNIQDALVSTTDMANTLVDLGGCDLGYESEGRSLMPIFAENANELRTRQWCLSEFGRRVMLETAKYKAVFDVDTGRAIAFYDMLSSQEERNNLVDEALGTHVLDSIRGQLGEALLPLRSALHQTYSLNKSNGRR